MAEFTGNEINIAEVNDSAVIKYVAETYHPADVFPDNELRDWAINNGFVEEDA